MELINPCEGCIVQPSCRDMCKKANFKYKELSYKITDKEIGLAYRMTQESYKHSYHWWFKKFIEILNLKKENVK